MSAPETRLPDNRRAPPLTVEDVDHAIAEHEREHEGGRPTTRELLARLGRGSSTTVQKLARAHYARRLLAEGTGLGDSAETLLRQAMTQALESLTGHAADAAGIDIARAERTAAERVATAEHEAAARVAAADARAARRESAHRELERRYEHARGKTESLIERCARLDAQIADAHHARDHAQRETERRDERIERLQNELESMTEDRDRRVVDHDVARQREADLRIETARLASAMERSTSDVERLERALDTARAQQETASAAHAAALRKMEGRIAAAAERERAARADATGLRERCAMLEMAQEQAEHQLALQRQRENEQVERLAAAVEASLRRSDEDMDAAPER